MLSWRETKSGWLRPTWFTASKQEEEETDAEGMKGGTSFSTVHQAKRKHRNALKWSKGRASVWVKLTNSPPGRRRRGGQRMEWGGRMEKYRSLQRRVTQRRSFLVVERGLWRYHGHYTEAIHRERTSTLRRLFLLESPADSSRES